MDATAAEQANRRSGSSSGSTPSGLVADRRRSPIPARAGRLPPVEPPAAVKPAPNRAPAGDQKNADSDQETAPEAGIATTSVRHQRRGKRQRRHDQVTRSRAAGPARRPPSMTVAAAGTVRWSVRRCRGHAAEGRGIRAATDGSRRAGALNPDASAPTDPGGSRPPGRCVDRWTRCRDREPRRKRAAAELGRAAWRRARAPCPSRVLPHRREPRKRRRPPLNVSLTFDIDESSAATNVPGRHELRFALVVRERARSQIQTQQAPDVGIAQVGLDDPVHAHLTGARSVRWPQRFVVLEYRPSMKLGWFAISLTLALHGAGCGNKSCVDGASISCACPSGGTGAQVRVARTARARAQRQRRHRQRQHRQRRHRQLHPRQHRQLRSPPPHHQRHLRLPTTIATTTRNCKTLAMASTRRPARLADATQGPRCDGRGREREGRPRARRGTAPARTAAERPGRRQDSSRRGQTSRRSARS